MQNARGFRFLAQITGGRQHARQNGMPLGSDRGRISDLRHGKLGRFSLETLIRFLTRMRYRIELRTISPREQNQQRRAERRPIVRP